MLAIALPRSLLRTLMDTLRQSILPQLCADIRILHFSRRHAASAAEVLLNENYLGISIVQAQGGGDIEYLAIATTQAVAVISLSDNHQTFPKDEALRTLLSAKQPILAGFNMPQLSIRLYCHLNYHVHAIDLSTFRSKTPRNPYYPSKLLCETMATSFDSFAVDSLWNDRLNEAEYERIRKVCLRAWISAIIIKKNMNAVHLIKPVETRWLKREVIVCLSRLLCEADILQRAKPTEITNDFSEAKMDSTGRLQVQNSRFNTRIRPSRQLAVVLTTSDGNEFRGSPKKSHGRQTEIMVPHRFYGTVTNVKVIGREGATNTEKARDELLLRALQGECHLRHSKFVRMLWFPSKDDEEDLLAETPIVPIMARKLNESQNKVVSAMVSYQPLVIVHGPPGTGKTSTISAAAEIWGRTKSPTWIVAHSNVAVKNIAEKLASSDVDFKIIVSKEFYVEWHEHLYTKIEERLFRGDEIPKNPVDLGRIIGASHIILSTLSMLSNPALDENRIFDLVPPRSLVIDEASQINVFEYMNTFFKFRNVTTKVCFFGDPKQLPPYGKDKAPSMQCIFDIDHLKDISHFLNIQYRMPHPLGEFISREVYNNQLLSEHAIKDASCIAFIDTKIGMEEKSGFSWRNNLEIRTVVHLVKLYYKDHNFCIITPYDAQRAAIERELKNLNLPWERVFNVDSFQGNEADIVLVSVVRCKEPGFLRSDQRMNVMLTRCRRGLVIITSRSFLSGPGQSTLVGKLARGRNWTEWTAVAEQQVDLPDAKGKYAPLRLSPAKLQLDGRRRNFDVKTLFQRQNQSSEISPTGTRTLSAVGSCTSQYSKILPLPSSSGASAGGRIWSPGSAPVSLYTKVLPSSVSSSVSSPRRTMGVTVSSVQTSGGDWSIAVGRKKKVQVGGSGVVMPKTSGNRFALLAVQER